MPEGIVLCCLPEVGNMTDQEYKAIKKEICAQQTACNMACPFFRYQEEHGVHACGCLCDVLEMTDLEKAKEIAAGWKA